VGFGASGRNSGFLSQESTVGTNSLNGRELQRLSPTPSTRKEDTSFLSRPSGSRLLPVTCKRAAPCCWQKTPPRSVLWRNTRRRIARPVGPSSYGKAQNLQPGLRPTSTRPGCSCRTGLSCIRAG
jgi:hypothetical protein